MPYIDKEKRNELDLELFYAETPGELNYVITTTLLDYIENLTQYECSQRKLDYTLLNEIMGVLESVKQEFYRRMVVPYEKEKEKINGDVY